MASRNLEVKIVARDMPAVKAELAAGAELAAALDTFFADLRYTAPEAIGMRLNQLGARIEEPMRAFGYPKEQARAS